MQPCQLGGLRRRRRSRPTSFSDGPHSLGHCATDFAGNVGCTPQQTVLIDNNPPAHPAQPRPRRRRRLAQADDFDFSLGQPRPGPGEPDRRRLLAGHRAGRLRHRGQVRAPATTSPRCSNLVVPARRRLLAAALAARRSRQRGAVLGADRAAAPRQRRPRGRLRRRRRPGPAGPGPRRGLRRALRARPAARSSTGASAPSSGPSCRPSCCRAKRPTRPSWSRRCPDSPRHRHLPVPRRRRDGAGNTATTTRRADGTEMALRKTAPSVAAEPAPPTEKTRIFARLALAPPPRHRDDRAVRRRRRLSGRLARADGAGIAGPRAAGRLPALARRRSRRPRVDVVQTGSTRRLRARAPGRPLAPDHGHLRRRRGGSRSPSRPSLSLRVRGGVSLPRGARLAAQRPGCSSERAGPQLAARRCRGAASWSRSSTSSRRPDAGARCWSPAPTTRPLPRPLPLPLRDRRRPIRLRAIALAGGPLALRPRLLASGQPFDGQPADTR